MDWTVIGTGIGTMIGVVSLIYAIIRNFRQDVDKRFDRVDTLFLAMDKRVTETNKRMDGVYHILLKRIGEEK